MGVVFDKLGCMRKLESGGDFTRTQAEKLTDAFYDAVVESVATKQDVGDVRTEIKEVRSEIREMKSDLRAEIAQLKVWVAGAAVVIVSVLSAIKFFS